KGEVKANARDPGDAIGEDLTVERRAKSPHEPEGEHGRPDREKLRHARAPSTKPGGERTQSKSREDKESHRILQGGDSWPLESAGAPRSTAAPQGAGRWWQASTSMQDKRRSASYGPGSALSFSSRSFPSPPAG